MMPSRVVSITDLLQCALVTKHIKTAVILQLATCFGRYPANKETVLIMLVAELFFF